MCSFQYDLAVQVKFQTPVDYKKKLETHYISSGSGCGIRALMSIMSNPNVRTLKRVARPN